MDHGYSGHDGHSMPMPHDNPMCAMNMLWNNQVADTCVVFKSWHIHGPWTMVLSCIAVIAVAIFYSFLLHQMKRLDIKLAYGLSNSAGRREGSSTRRESLIPPIPTGYNAIETGNVKTSLTRLPMQARLFRAFLYAMSVTISFWLMLVAMTYNTFLFFSIVVGAFIGHVMYEGEIDIGSLLGGAGAKGLACH
ncbi:hypothetical protein M231_03606 [Tremella mesenterica]|uniref:Copper transport protein n=1 Tax=Tremella mesenterica TaxID=5217 RepID=A0A4Q1BMN6_TREME|nr:hypothetical protein M231_03606 [Tremella mesenterica]